MFLFPRICTIPSVSLIFERGIYRRGPARIYCEGSLPRFEAGPDLACITATVRSVL